MFVPCRLNLQGVRQVSFGSLLPVTHRQNVTGLCQAMVLENKIPQAQTVLISCITNAIFWVKLTGTNNSPEADSDSNSPAATYLLQPIRSSFEMCVNEHTAELSTKFHCCPLLQTPPQKP